MDIVKIINSVKNINDYITFTQDLVEEYKSPPIMLNMENVLALKKIASLEVEYFSKCYKSGAAFIIFDQILRNPPSKTWSLLGKELVSLLQYWAQRLLKHLISHCLYYQAFLKSLLKFINEMRLKEPMMSTTLVEQTAECLLDLATDDRLDLMHILDVIKCLNYCCVLSSKDIRAALYQKFTPYFIKLSRYISTCAHFPSQLCIVELLLRWLLRRQDRGVRQNAARLWFSYMCAEAVAIFVERPFRDFLKDARDFLNAYNASKNDITSVVCRKLTIGGVTVIAGTERLESWIDVNSTQGSVSVVVDPRILQALGVRDVTIHEVITIAADNTDAACLHRQSDQIVLSIKTIEPTEFLNTCALFLSGNSKTIMIYISSKSDMDKLDNALRRAFGDKFENKLENANTNLSSSHSSQDIPETAKRFSETDEDVRFSVPHVVSKRVFAQNPIHNQKRPKRTGLRTMSRKVSGWNSPSSTSTTSLAQLHEKLANLPKIHYDKEPLTVCLEPELSIVTERSEPEDASLLNDTASTYKFKSYKYKKCNLKSYSRKAKTSPSDNEDVRAIKVISASQSDEEENSLFVATINSDEESVINDTLQFQKNYEITNLVDLLAQEALNSKSNVREKDMLQDSGINTGNNKEAQEVNSEAIENTPLLSTTGRRKTLSINRTKQTSRCTVVSKSTSDESNTEPYCPKTKNELFAKINQAMNSKDKVASTSDESITDATDKTPVNYVTDRRNKTKKPNDNAELNKIYDVQENSLFEFNSIANICAKHENQNEKNINETLTKTNNQSSKSSESCDVYLASAYQGTGANIGLEQFKIDPQVVECLNLIVDKVCNDFEKCAEYFDKQERHSNLLQKLNYINKITGLEKEMDSNKQNDETTVPSFAAATKKTETVKLIFKKKTPKKDLTGKKKINKKDGKKLQSKSSNKTNMKNEKNIQEVIPENNDKSSTKKIEHNEPLTQGHQSKLFKSRSSISIIHEQVELIDLDVNKQNDEIADTPSKIISQQPEEVKKCKTKITKETLQLNTLTKIKTQDMENIKQIVKSKNEIKSPQTAVKKNTCDEHKASVTPLQNKRKRKLYSPKDIDEVINEQPVTETSVETSDEKDDIVPLSKYKNKSKFNTPHIRLNIRDIPTPECEAVCYKELEKVRKKHIRLPKKSKSKKQTSPLVSPRTLRNDQLFEKLKEGIDLTGVKLVDKNSSLAIYNYTSDSSDEDFKTKKIEFSTSADSIKTKKGRVGKRKIKPESKTNSSNEEERKHDVKKRKRPVKRQNTKGKGKNTNVNIIKDLEDEKLRNAEDEVLNSSFIAVINQNNAQKEVEPKFNNLSQLEIIPGTEFDEKKETQNLEKKTKEKKHNEKILSKNKKQGKGKSQQKLQIIEDKHEDESPLPALRIETISKDIEDDQGSWVSSKMVKICNKVIQDGDYLNDTSQNLTTDAENPYCSPGQSDIPVEIHICKKLEVNNNDNSRYTLEKSGKVVPNKKLDKKKKGTIDLTNINLHNKEKPRSDTLYSSELGISNEEKEIHTVDLDIEEPVMIKDVKKYQKDTESKEQDLIEIENDINEKVSEKSIKTADIETSLSKQTLSEHISPRDLELQDLNSSKRKYFLQLRAAIGENCNQNNANEQTYDVEIQGADENNFFLKDNSKFLHSPVVSITKLSNDAVRKWLSSPRSPISEVTSQKLLQESSSKEDASKETTCHDEAKEANSKFPSSPVVSITRLSDDDFKKWLPSPGSSVSEVIQQKALQKSNKVTPKRGIEIKPITVRKEISDIDSINSEESQILKTHVKVVSKTKTNLEIPKENTKRTPKRRQGLETKKLVAERKHEPTRKIFSVISPINMDISEEEEEIDKTLKSLEETDDSLKKNFRELFSQCFNQPKTPDTHVSSTQEVSSPIENKKAESVKRRPFTQEIPSKRRKVEMNTSEIEMLSASGPSVNSVHEWIMKDVPKSLSASGYHSACNDSMQSVLEKLDTTLLEINQNTSRKFVNMFVEMKGYYDTIVEKRRQRNNKATKQMFAMLFAEFNNGFDEMNKDFDRELKRRAAKLIREDCQHKQAMVRLLREDVESAMKNVEKRTK